LGGDERCQRRDEKRAVKEILRGVINKVDAARNLGVILRTIQRYVKHFLEKRDEAT
jgi:hypothetical protein